MSENREEKAADHMIKTMEFFLELEIPPQQIVELLFCAAIDLGFTSRDSREEQINAMVALFTKTINDVSRERNDNKNTKG